MGRPYRLISTMTFHILVRPHYIQPWNHEFFFKLLTEVIMDSQYHGCWWLSDARWQGSSNYGIELVIRCRSNPNISSGVSLDCMSRKWAHTHTHVTCNQRTRHIQSWPPRSDNSALWSDISFINLFVEHKILMEMTDVTLRNSLAYSVSKEGYEC